MVAGRASPWDGWLEQVRAHAARRGAHLARTVVLLPYANLLAPARQAWAARFAGYVPRFQTTRNWAQDAGVFAPGPQDLWFDHAHDLLNAQALLEQAGLGAQAAPLAGRLLDVARQLAPLAAAQEPTQRAHWLARVDAVLPAVQEGPLRLEGVLTRVAAAWVGNSAYATDVLFGAAVGRQLDLLAIVPGLQSEPLVAALAAHWDGKVAVLAHEAPDEVPEGGGQVALHEAQDAEDEAERAAACVLRHLAAGRVPVAVVASDRLLVRRVNALLGAADVNAATGLRDETGWKLSTTHAAASVVALLRACAPWASSDAVLDWIKLAPAFAGRDHRALEHRLRKEAVRHWRDAAALAPDDPLVQQVQALREPMAGARPLARWLADLRALLQACGLWPVLTADAAGSAMVEALGLADDALAQWQAWPAASRGMPLADFIHWVSEVLEHANYQPPHPDVARVVVLPMAQLLGRSPAALVLPGADERHLPAAPEPPGLWTAAQRLALGLPTREQGQREQAGAWALALSVPQVDVLYRRADDSGEPVLASPLVQALRLAPGARLRPGDDARRVREVVPAPTPRPRPVGTHLPAQPLSASSYEQLRACPYRFFALRQLGLQDEGELDVDVDKRDWGIWVHAVLRDFHEALRRTPDAGRVALMEAAARQVTQDLGLAGEPGEFLPFEVAWPQLRDAYLRWLQDHEAGGAVFAAAEEDLKVRRGTLELRGRIDRLDRLDRVPGGELLIDYKTEALQKTRDRIKAGSEETQLPFYALLSGAEAPRAAYLNLAEREEPSLHELPDLAPLAWALEAGMARDMARIAQGAPLPALGEGSVCDWCEVRGLCRKDFWNE